MLLRQESPSRDPKLAVLLRLDGFPDAISGFEFPMEKALRVIGGRGLLSR